MEATRIEKKPLLNRDLLRTYSGGGHGRCQNNQGKADHRDNQAVAEGRGKVHLDDSLGKMIEAERRGREKGFSRICQLP